VQHADASSVPILVVSDFCSETVHMANANNGNGNGSVDKNNDKDKPLEKPELSKKSEPKQPSAEEQAKLKAVLQAMYPNDWETRFKYLMMLCHTIRRFHDESAMQCGAHAE
jgi:hypothetical protein